MFIHLQFPLGSPFRSEHMEQNMHVNGSSQNALFFEIFHCHHIIIRMKFTLWIKYSVFDQIRDKVHTEIKR